MGNYRFDLYSALGVSKNASMPEIKQAYLKLAKKFHPDRNSNLSPLERKANEEKMYRLNEAFATLSNPQERVKYDLMSEIVNKAHPNESLENLASEVVETVVSIVIDSTAYIKKFGIAEFAKMAYRSYEEEKYYRRKDINRRV